MGPYQTTIETHCYISSKQRGEVALRLTGFQAERSISLFDIIKLWTSWHTRKQSEVIGSSLPPSRRKRVSSRCDPENRKDQRERNGYFSYRTQKRGRPRGLPLSSNQPDGSVPSTGQRRPGLPRADPAVLSARWGLASGFGTGPGVPPMLWPLTGGRRPPLRCPGSVSRALGAAWRIGEV